MSKLTVDVICRALLAIVAALRKEYGLPAYHSITITLEDNTAGVVNSAIMSSTK